MIKAARAAATIKAPMTAPDMRMLTPASSGAMVGESVGRNSPMGNSEGGHSAPSLSNKDLYSKDHVCPRICKRRRKWYKISVSIYYYHQRPLGQCIVLAYYIGSKYNVPNTIKLWLLTLQYPLVTLKRHPPPWVRLRAQQSPVKTLWSIMVSHDTDDQRDRGLSCVFVSWDQTRAIVVTKRRRVWKTVFMMDDECGKWVSRLERLE